MKTVQEIRFENFELLIKEAGTIAELARKTGYDKPAYLYQLRAQVVKPNGKTLQLGRRVAMRLEQGMNKPTGWMDIDHNIEPASAKVAVSGSLKAVGNVIGVALTSPESAVYGVSVIRALLSAGKQVCVAFNDVAARAFEQAGIALNDADAVRKHFYATEAQLSFADEQLSPFALDAVVVPAARGSIMALIANGATLAPAARMAELALATKRPVLIAPCETVLSAAQLHNMQTLLAQGAVILPVSAAASTEQAEFLTACVLAQLGLQ